MPAQHLDPDQLRTVPMPELRSPEAQLLVDAAQLAGPLRERCGLLGRALNAIWGLVSEEDQQALTAVLEKAAGC